MKPEDSRSAERRTSIVIGLFLLAVAFHFLTTLSLGGARLRVSSADLLLPLVGTVIAWHWYTGGCARLRWRLPYVSIWLGVLSVWMLVALVNGYLHTGNWQTWALVNKTFGWFVLVAYLVVGAWFGANHATMLKDSFLTVFLLVGWTICAGEVLMYALYYHGVVTDTSYARPQGFFANPNAFGFVVSVMLVIQAPFLLRRQLLPLLFHRVGLALALLALVFSASRTAVLGFAVAVPALIWLREIDIRQTIVSTALAVAIGISLLYIPFQLETWIAALRSPAQTAHAEASAGTGTASISEAPAARKVTRHPMYWTRYLRRIDLLLNDASVRHWTETTQHALELWRQSPLLGIGLGSFDWEQERAKAATRVHIPNTALWLLTETGLVGVLLFGAFFLACFRVVLVQLHRPNRDPFLAGFLGVLLVVAGASIGMEAMYQRHVWLLLGWALALSIFNGDTAQPLSKVPRV